MSVDYYIFVVQNSKMPCCAPLCPSNAVKVSLFGVPKNETLKLKWEKALGVSLKPHSKVCRRHFREEDITDTWESGEGSSKYVVNTIHFVFYWLLH